MRCAAIAVACAALLGCGEPPTVRPPALAGDAAVGPSPREIAAQKRQRARRESISEMNLGVEAATTRDYGAAEPHLRRAIELDPDNHAAHYNLGIVLLSKDEFKSAVAYFDRALELSNSADYRLALGRALYANGSFDAARVALAQAAVAKPDLYDAHYHLGLIFAGWGRYEESITPLRECTRLTKTISGCFAQLAAAHYELDELESAIAAANDGLGHHDGDPQMLLVLGKSQLKTGKPGLAAKTLAKLVAADEQNTDARLWWAMALAESGDRKKARALIKVVVAALGDSAGRYDVDFARQLARKKRRATDAPLVQGKGEIAANRLRIDYAKHLDEKVTVRGYVAWKYDCARALGKKVARKQPERCALPHFYLGATKSPWPDRALWVVDVPRAPRADEKKHLPKETLDAWPKVPRVVVGNKIAVTGTWAVRSPRGFMRTLGLLVFDKLEPAK